jgi:hypothetical protein
MIEGAGSLRFQFKAMHALGPGGNVWWQDFYCDMTAEACVSGTIDLTHASFADKRTDLIPAKSCAGLDIHL